jgi:hypothetical protein
MIARVSAAIVAGPGVAAVRQVEQAQACGALECFTFDRDNSGGKLVLSARATIRACRRRGRQAVPVHET